MLSNKPLVLLKPVALTVNLTKPAWLILAYPPQAVLAFSLVWLTAPLVIAMSCSVIDTTTVKLEGSIVRREWKIKSSNIVHVANKRFVKLAPHCHGFVGIVCEGQCAVPKNPSLLAAKGFADLVELRNRSQAEMFQASVAPGFYAADELPEPAAKKPRMSRGEVGASRGSPEILTIVVGGKEVQVLRPVHSRDDLAVVLEATALDAIIHHIRSSGLTTELLGIKRHYNKDACGQYLFDKKDNVYYRKLDGSEGKKWQKLQPTLDQ